jgi:tetratricopeptide (TPR) repeat protein
VRLLIVFVAIAAVAIAAVPAFADDTEAAAAAFAAGEAADKRKAWREAIGHYQRAYDLSPHPFALFNIAADHEKLGENRKAVELYRRYLDESDDSSDRDKVGKLIEKLRRRPSRISITSTPNGARIAIDGDVVGNAPIEREVAAGDHEIVATIGDRRATRRVTVEYGEPLAIAMPVLDQQGTLVITSNVTGAQVEIDGQYAGETPLTILVAAGDRAVIVKSEGYSSLERQVKVPAEGSAQITATLVRPLGYVEPPNPSTRAYAIGLESGYVFAVNAAVVHATFGLRAGRYQIDGRFGYLGTGSYAYGFGLRYFVGTSRFRLFFGADVEWAVIKDMTQTDPTPSGVFDGRAGFLFERLFSGERVVDSGVALIPLSDDTRQVAFPVTATLVFRTALPTSR